uniref:Uncharacterized protein n=1 Tax=Plectus sambesii TaxID=2011161 RepID=A0A914WDH9_9BILA
MRDFQVFGRISGGDHVYRPLEKVGDYETGEGPTMQTCHFETYGRSADSQSPSLAPPLFGKPHVKRITSFGDDANCRARINTGRPPFPDSPHRARQSPFSLARASQRLSSWRTNP